MTKPRVLLIGWDAADWKVIRPLLAAGQMPNLARLIAAGVSGNVATIYPVLSPMLWTSIATGKRAYKHGIHGFSEPLPDGSGVRPITLLSRKTKAIWNILNQTGHRSIVVGWWPSHPAEPINGVMVSNHFPHRGGNPDESSPLLAGSVHPQGLAASLADLRVGPMELSGDFIRLFVPEYEKVDQAKDKRLHALGRIIAETMSIHAVATELLETQPWDFAAIYYNAIDHFGHGFMSYHPPRLPRVTEKDFDIYQHVIANAYRYHDAMLGALLAFADENTTVILMSDHGFHPDHQRANYIPAEAAGPAIEHRHFGILCLKGPRICVNEQLFGAGLLDLCPTLLTLFGLPPGKDMDGKVLLNAFKEAPLIEPIESWDNVAGDAGTHSPDAQLDPVASAQAFQQLVEQGYVAPPGPDVKETVDSCVRELKYNLARAYRDGDCCGEAAALAEELWTQWPQEHRFGILLADCLIPLGQSTRRRAVIEELELRIKRYQTEADTELTRRKEERANKQEEKGRSPGRPSRRDRFEERRLRELANGRPLLLDWLRLNQALLEKRPAEARRISKKLLKADIAAMGMRQRVAGALVELGDLKAAEKLLRESLDFDSENPMVYAHLASVHFKAGRFSQAIVSAAESLSLLYFQPGIHALLGQALMETSRFAEAEQELRVAVAQSPRNLTAHTSLGKLYRQHLNRPDEAFAHEGRALSLRHELDTRLHAKIPTTDIPSDFNPGSESNDNSGTSTESDGVPSPFGDTVDAEQVITVVSGLPRSGTSLMMQLLRAAGREPLTDAKRAPDEDNPLGYFEFQKALTLAKDKSWLPQVRGKVVKIVAQLLSHLPRNEHYNVILMERKLTEVIASQKAMLVRHGRRGAELDKRQLLKTYAAHLQRVRRHLSRRPEIRVLRVNYADLLADPGLGVERVARFLGNPFDQESAAKAVRPELRRQKT
jgi:predicted AlkP superfamily phosphohydrolase/phosphomutase/tetratricopeptide (TPR) repeat protein